VLERLVRALPAVAWMTLIFAMSSREQFPAPPGFSIYMLSIVAHLFLYSVLATLLLVAFERDGRATRTARLAAICGAVLYGISDEFHQSFVPGRDSSLFDVGINTIGAILAVTIWAYLRPILSATLSR
jgi:VanZ family protein